MLSEYGKQIKAFFHFMFKHLFEGEFAIRVFVEILIYLWIIYILLGIFHKIICIIRACIGFINWNLVAPLRIRLFDKLALLRENSDLQKKANKIREAYKEEGMKIKKKKHYEVWWFLIYPVMVTWIICFHYYGEKQRSSYEVFFQ